MTHDTQYLNLIRTAAKAGNVNFTHHAAQRMNERHISRAMVMDALNRGTMRRPPEPNLQHGTMEVELIRYTAGVHIGVVVGIINQEIFITVITVYQRGNT